MKRERGFTILELVVVIFFASLLLILFFLQKLNLDAMHRDEQRKEAINAMYYALEEGFHAKNGYYPENISEENLKVMDPSLFTDPSGINLGQEDSDYTYEAANCTNGKCKEYTLKARLEKEGLFDSKHKKRLPEFPKHIGVVTSETGAAVKDILAIIQARTKLTNVSIFPVSVQGDRASSEISHMIDFLSDTRSEDIDLLIVGRGGGSPEDLMVFNSEELARSIYACNIPVISAVGHEIDFTIADFVADVRAETPTAAAELSVPDMKLLYEKINKLHEDISLNLSNRLMYDDIRIKNIYDSISHILTNKIQSYENTLNRLALLLSENNPRAILERGYSILSDEKGMPIANVSKLKIEASYKLNLSDGSADCKIYNISEDVNYGRQ